MACMEAWQIVINVPTLPPYCDIQYATCSVCTGAILMEGGPDCLTQNTKFPPLD